MFPVLLIYNLVALFPLAKCFSLYMFDMFHFIHNITIDAVYDFNYYYYMEKKLITIWNFVIILEKYAKIFSYV